MDSAEFRRTCARFATGIIVAAVSVPGGGPHGMTVNSFTSVSLEPALILFCVDRAASLLELFRTVGRCGLSVLSADQQAVSVRFAERGRDRFDGFPHVTGSTGVPLIPGALAHLECEIRDTVEAGDHVILIAEALAADISEGAAPLVYFDSVYRRLG